MVSLGIATVALLLGSGVTWPAAAETYPLRQSIETAKSLIVSGRSAEAQALLEQAAAAHPRSNDVAFLLGLLAIQSQKYEQAVDYFRAILVRNPEALRVRLELGRAFFLKHDYENAYRQFQFARAGKLPPAVHGSIDRYVTAIRQQKNWSYNFSFALAPDSNINSGPSSRETELFGLPFELSSDTRRKSGIGVSIDAGSEFAPLIGEHVRLRLGGQVQRREYRDREFDDTIIALHAGPRLVLPRWDISLLATGFRRQLGGRRLSEGLGAKIEAIHYRGARTAISFGTSSQHVRYPDHPFQDGRAFSLWGSVVRALTPSSSVSTRLAASRKTARTPELASWSGWVAAGYYRDLPGGFSVYVEPSYGASRYDAADPFFRERRKDRLLEVQIAVLNRTIVLDRFTPRVALTLARRHSNIDLYEYKQKRLEVGLTSSF